MRLPSKYFDGGVHFININACRIGNRRNIWFADVAYKNPSFYAWRVNFTHNQSAFRSTHSDPCGRGIGCKNDYYNRPKILYSTEDFVHWQGSEKLKHLKWIKRKCSCLYIVSHFWYHVGIARLFWKIKSCSFRGFADIFSSIFQIPIRNHHLVIFKVIWRWTFVS